VIPYSLVEMAMARDIEVDEYAPVTYGVDVARFGSDKSALAKKKGNVIIDIKKWAGLDLMQLTGAIKAEYDAEDFKDRPLHIYVDSIGLGSGVVDRLRELGLPAIGINVSESPAMKSAYMNLRSELWSREAACCRKTMICWPISRRPGTRSIRLGRCALSRRRR
jgi:phage terminase large subunit